VSTLDPDSETAVTPTPAKTPSEPAEQPAESAEQPIDEPTKPAGAVASEQASAEPTEKAAEPAADEPTKAAEIVESAEPAEPAAVTEEPAEPVEADEPAAEPAAVAEEPTKPVEADEPAEPTASAEPADEPAEEPTGAVATEEPAEKPADEPAITAPSEAAGLRSRRMLVPAVLAALALGSAIAVGVLGWQAYSDARAQRAQTAALDAAKTGTVQVLSYDSKTLDADLARSRTLISGAFAAKFEELAGSVIEPAVKQQNLGTKATVARSAVIDAQPDQVRALLFVNQTTTVGSDPAPHTASNQVRVTMTWTDGHWLISDMQPL
jgi:Mce-associated membrane protein